MAIAQAKGKLPALSRKANAIPRLNKGKPRAMISNAKGVKIMGRIETKDLP